MSNTELIIKILILIFNTFVVWITNEMYYTLFITSWLGFCWLYTEYQQKKKD